MSENEKMTRDVSDLDTSGETYRGRIADFFWDLNYVMIATIVGIVLVVACIVWGFVSNQRAWRGECHDAGGHVINVENADICVDRENRVIFL